MTNIFRRILVPHDFSEHATQALRVAADLAARHRGRLIVLHAITPFTPPSGFPPAEETVWFPPVDLIAHERRHLAALVARTVRGRGAPRVDCRVEFGDPHQRIVDSARGVDLIVMATAGRTGLSHLLIGSVAEKVVRHSPVPVLTIRSKDRRARKARRKPRGRTRRR